MVRYGALTVSRRIYASAQLDSWKGRLQKFNLGFPLALLLGTGRPGHVQRPDRRRWMMCDAMLALHAVGSIRMRWQHSRFRLRESAGRYSITSHARTQTQTQTQPQPRHIYSQKLLTSLFKTTVFYYSKILLSTYKNKMFLFFIWYTISFFLSFFPFACFAEPERSLGWPDSGCFASRH